MKKRKTFLILAAVLVLVFLFMVGRRTYLNRKGNLSAKNNPPARLTQALLIKEINKEFSFGLKDKEKTKIKYLIESGEILNEIIVRGEPVKALPGRSFLILNLKITNEGRRGIQINSRDFVRLSLAANEEWQAPDIHNDPVEVQAISTKYSRLGFPIKSGEKEFKMRLGEIEGEKTNFDLSF